MKIPPDIEAGLSPWLDLQLYHPETGYRLRRWSGIPKHTPGVYILRHQLSGMHYIGSSGGLGDRLSFHRTNLFNGTHYNHQLQHLYLASPEFRYAYMVTPTREAALDLEQLLLDLNVGSSKVVNINPDARLSGKGRKPTDENLRNLKEAQQSEIWIAKNKAHTSSVAYSDKARKQFSKPALIDGVFYSSATEASSKLGIPKTTVLHRLRSATFPQWQWKEETA